MCKIDFYLLPSKKYKMINNEDLLDLNDSIIAVKENDRMFVPNEFYERADSDGINGVEYIYGKERSDLSDFLMEIISKQSSANINYKDIEQKEDIGYVLISQTDILPKKGELCVKSVKNTYEKGEFTISDLLKVKRYYLDKVEDYDSYIKRSYACYPTLIFHEDAFKNIKKLGKLSEIIQELSRHLEALNDYGNIIYDECKGNESQALNSLGIKCNITCSGKGANEKKIFKKQMNFEGTQYRINCNSHTKFFNGNNNQRIYFSWGRDEIRNHGIIIVSIGTHWEK